MTTDATTDEPHAKRALSESKGGHNLFRCSPGWRDWRPNITGNGPCRLSPRSSTPDMYGQVLGSRDFRYLGSEAKCTHNTTVCVGSVEPAKLDRDCEFCHCQLCGKDFLVSTEPQEQRRYPRIDLSQAVQIRPFDPSLPPDYCTTLNASQDGLYFPTQAGHYVLGMRSM